MLTDTEIVAGDIRRLRPEAHLALSNLVRRSEAFKRAGLYYLDVLQVIQAAVNAAHVPAVIAANEPNVAAADAAALTAGATPENLALVKALAAVCMKLAKLPGVAVESEGSDKARSHFSSPVNWDELALDVINVLYVTPPVVANAFAVATRKLYDTPCAAGMGYVWGCVDELRFAVRGPMYFSPMYFPPFPC